MYSIQGVSKEANATQDKVVYRICMTIKMPLVLSLSMKLKEKVVLTVIYPEDKVSFMLACLKLHQ